MKNSFSSRSDIIKTLILLLVCGVSAVVSTVLGINDNPPGVLLALLAAIAFVLAFAHPWRTARKFMFLLLAAVLGFVLFFVLSIISDSIAQNSASSIKIQNLIGSRVYDSLSLVFIMICLGAFIVGAIGSVVMFIRNRRQTK